MLKKTKRSPFYPLISSLGVKIVVNTVNMIKSPLYFQSRREISSIQEGIETSFVNKKSWKKTPFLDEPENNLVIQNADLNLYIGWESVGAALVGDFLAQKSVVSRPKI